MKERGEDVVFKIISYGYDAKALIDEFPILSDAKIKELVKRSEEILNQEKGNTQN
jgi:hypothetical protein